MYNVQEANEPCFFRRTRMALKNFWDAGVDVLGICGFLWHAN
jgi:hypothetical protein